jgi:predicted RNA polymerase sigma factor
MGQRLVRAKAAIREAGIGFAVPDAEELPARLGAVLEAIYTAYGTAWDDVDGADPRRRDLTEEAVWLGRLVFGLLPQEPEAAGLLALMLHCEARRTARRDGDGGYVPLDRQDVSLWRRPMIDEAERLLAGAASAGRPGRFQYEAAIQSAHAARGVTGRTDWPAIVLLYDALLALAPSIGARIGRAAALVHVAGASAALDALDELDPCAVITYQPYWALRAHLLRQEGAVDPALAAYERARGLSESPAVRDFLSRSCRGEGVTR